LEFQSEKFACLQRLQVLILHELAKLENIFVFHPTTHKLASQKSQTLNRPRPCRGSKWSVSSQNNLLSFAVFLEAPLVQVWMTLDLICDGHDSCYDIKEAFEYFINF
jgi:hypothetical protein